MSGTKHDSGKSPWHLLPFDAVGDIVKVLEFGSRKYAERNWEKGIAYSRVFAAAQRHLTSWWQGEDKDPESGLSHLAHASCCTLFLLAFVARKRTDLDDRPGSDRSRESSPPGYLCRVEPSPLGPVEAPPRADTLADALQRSIGGLPPGPKDPPVPPPYRVG